ncbi:MAG: hypothetical protein LAO20_10640 [Acidobacteriia bacterium]|nr:hypothetical protein [Terriglobia bacterium]
MLFPILTLVGLSGGTAGQKSDAQLLILAVPSGKIEVTLPDEQLSIARDDILAWIKTAARTVSTYYGRFPVPHLTLRVRTDDRSGVHRGVTYAKDGGLILISVGRDTSLDALKDDWTLTHEMVHLAFPSMGDNHHWIEEGISTYVEPVARAQAGGLPVDEVWRQFIRDMPKGQPQYGDHGLDNTPTWGRTYWGGAMFCLLADVRIRERTHNRKGLQDALRAIRNHGGVISQDWDLEKALAIGDKATGTKVLQELYAELRDKPSPVDLDELWKKLGLALDGRDVHYDDQAPEAAIRKAITARK